MNQFYKTELLIGESGINKLKNSNVIVFGIGGVGGYSVEGLIRSGISSVILVDYDTIEVSNLNRQIIADSKHIGFFKVDEMERRILNINPDCKVIKIYDRLSLDNLDVEISPVDKIIFKCLPPCIQGLVVFSVDNKRYYLISKSYSKLKSIIKKVHL